MAQQQAADQQNQLHEANRRNAMIAHQNTQSAINTRQVQEQDAAANEKFEASLDKRRAVATNIVAAGESGIHGLSVDGLIRDIYGRHGRYEANVNQNLDWTMSQLQSEKKASGTQMVDRINSVPRANRPNFLATGLQILGSGIDTTAAYRRGAFG